VKNRVGIYIAKDQDEFVRQEGRRKKMSIDMLQYSQQRDFGGARVIGMLGRVCHRSGM